MQNVIYLIGRIIEITDSGNIKLTVQRQYKNEDGIYESDTFPIYCKVGVDHFFKGDLVGVKGYLRNYVHGNKVVSHIVAEKISLLTPKGGNK